MLRQPKYDHPKVTEQSLYDCSCDVTIFMPYNGMSHPNMAPFLNAYDRAKHLTDSLEELELLAALLVGLVRHTLSSSSVFLT